MIHNHYLLAMGDVQVTRISMLGLALACVVSLILIHKIFSPRQKRLEQDLTKKYPLIYRVTAAPSLDRCFLVANGASVEVGDYGWEAESIQNDGLIYLQGLNNKWQVVWYAGFRSDQIEIVGPKPRSQYYIFPYWRKNNIPPCEYSVKKYQHGEYLNAHFGFPVQIRNNWVQGRRVQRSAV
jgi:hypothetical protein